MSEKPELFLFDTSPVNRLAIESVDDFKRWVLDDKLKPSVALRKMMDKYSCPTLHATVVIELVELTYPDIETDREGFRFKIVDSAYPNSDPKQFGDDDFDACLEELLSLPPIEW